MARGKSRREQPAEHELGFETFRTTGLNKLPPVTRRAIERGLRRIDTRHAVAAPGENVEAPTDAARNVENGSSRGHSRHGAAETLKLTT
jgi:hypothetical protein